MVDNANLTNITSTLIATWIALEIYGLVAIWRATQGDNLMDCKCSDSGVPAPYGRNIAPMRVYHRRGSPIGESQERVAMAKPLPGMWGMRSTSSWSWKSPLNRRPRSRMATRRRLIKALSAPGATASQSPGRHVCLQARSSGSQRHRHLAVVPIRRQRPVYKLFTHDPLVQSEHPLTLTPPPPAPRSPHCGATRRPGGRPGR